MLFKSLLQIRDSLFFCQSLICYIRDQVNGYEIFSFFMNLDQGFHSTHIFCIIPDKLDARSLKWQRIAEIGLMIPGNHVPSRPKGARALGKGKSPKTLLNADMRARISTITLARSRPVLEMGYQNCRQKIRKGEAI